jgi:hypothetical protein
VEEERNELEKKKKIRFFFPSDYEDYRHG